MGRGRGRGRGGKEGGAVPIDEEYQLSFSAPDAARISFK